MSICWSLFHIQVTHVYVENLEAKIWAILCDRPMSGAGGIVFLAPVDTPEVVFDNFPTISLAALALPSATIGSCQRKCNRNEIELEHKNLTTVVILHTVSSTVGCVVKLYCHYIIKWNSSPFIHIFHYTISSSLIH